MAVCRWIARVERWFDGEQSDRQAVETHLQSCTACRKHVAVLETLRTGVGAMAQPPSIQDAQLPAFLAGIREGVQAERPHHRGLWTYISLAAAALIVAFSTFMMIPSGHDEVVATVESAETDLEGGSVVYETQGNTTTVWVEVSEHRDIQ